MGIDTDSYFGHHLSADEIGRLDEILTARFRAIPDPITYASAHIGSYGLYGEPDSEGNIESLWAPMAPSFSDEAVKAEYPDIKNDPVRITCEWAKAESRIDGGWLQILQGPMGPLYVYPRLAVLSGPRLKDVVFDQGEQVTYRRVCFHLANALGELPVYHTGDFNDLYEGNIAEPSQLCLDDVREIVYRHNVVAKKWTDIFEAKKLPNGSWDITSPRFFEDHFTDFDDRNYIPK